MGLHEGNERTVQRDCDADVVRRKIEHVGTACDFITRTREKEYFLLKILTIYRDPVQNA